MDGEPLQRTDPKLTALVLQGRAEGRRQAFAEAVEKCKSAAFMAPNVVPSPVSYQAAWEAGWAAACDFLRYRFEVRAKGGVMGNDNMDQVRAAHAKTLATMSNRDLAILLMADHPQRYPEDEWFRDLIRDELKRRPIAARAKEE